MMMSENRPGQGATLADFGCKSIEPTDSYHACPTCSDRFDTRKNMKIHHVHAHGESLAGESVECDNCGDVFQRRSSEIERYEKHFCCRECLGEYQSENHTGENSPTWNGGKSTYECEICRSEVKRHPSHAKNNVICSEDCMEAFLAWVNRGETFTECKCDRCGDSYETKPSWLRESQNNYCSRECADAAHSDRMRGDGNPRWEGGKVDYNYCGPNWEDKRRQTLERDNHTCVRCGDEDDLHVHHIRPRRKFIEDGEYDYEAANQLDNLTTLCVECHPTVEAWPLELDVKHDT